MIGLKPRVLPALTRSITTVNSALLRSSSLKIEAAHSSASDQLGDVMAKRWLGGVGAGKGNDTDRVS